MKYSSEFFSKNREKVKKMKRFLRELKKFQHLLKDKVLRLSFIDRKSAHSEWMKTLRLKESLGLHAEKEEKHYHTALALVW